MDDDMRDAFERRASRPGHRDADEVLRAAHRDADQPSRRRAPLGLPIGIAALVVAVVAAGAAMNADDPRSGETAGPPTTPGAPQVVIAQNASSLVLFDDCTAVLDDLKAQALQRVGPYGLNGYGGWGGPIFVGGELDQSAFGPVRAAKLATASATTAEKSATNTQEAGVDEPDLVETDGERLYDVRGGVLHIVDIEGARVEATLPLNLVNVRGAMLVDERLVVLADEPLTSGRSGEAKVVMVDVAGAPSIQQRLTVDGLLVDARAVDGQVHIVTVSPPSIEFTYPTSYGDEKADDAATEANKERIRTSTLADWLPSKTVTGADGDVVGVPGLLTDCAAIRHPKEFAGFDQTSLVTLDLDDLSRSPSTSVQASSLLVYGSAGTLYTATTTYQDVDPDTGVGRPFVPNSGSTDIHRFALGDVPTYSGSGRIEGYVDDQFGLSEHDGHLRVASSTWTERAESRVTVLRIDDGELVTTGTVTGLGPNEQIQGVRFIGDLGYVVTFRQTDPLYVIDLRNPAKPTLAGELQIPGFSAYLHPVGEDLLLGVGFDGTESGDLTGAAASLFDVSDPANPRRADLEAFGGDPKTADDHHAFTWWDDTGIAYIPVGKYADGNRIEVVQVADGVLTPVGEIEPAGDGAPAKAAFDRIVIVGDQVLSISPEGVQVSARGSLEPIAWIDYP